MPTIKPDDGRPIPDNEPGGARSSPAVDDMTLGNIGHSDSPADREDDSFVALFGRLVDDAERFVRAELRLYRANLFSRLAETRTAIIMILTSFLLAQSAIIALLVGLVVILRPSLGAIGATAAVVGGSITVALLLAWLAMNKFRAVTDIKDKAP
ncbi:phage holin family protein [Sphingomonas sp. 28-62-11]|uniref:phage holin family protein n=1 Tax=Sphingomonas sp. 28-62-11 TaxID=1970432 RepID=UPI0035A94AFF